jgi:hypothetical protein
MVIDVGIFLDIGICLWDVGLGLVVIIVTDEVFYSVMRGGKKFFNSPNSCAAKVLLGAMIKVVF